MLSFDADLAAIDVESVINYNVQNVVDTEDDRDNLVNLNVSIENLELLQKKDKSLSHLYDRLKVADESI